MKITSLSKILVLLALFTAMLTTSANAQQTLIIPANASLSGGFPISPSVTSGYPMLNRGHSMSHYVYSANDLGNQLFDITQFDLPMATNESGSTTMTGYIDQQTMTIFFRFTDPAPTQALPLPNSTVSEANYTQSIMIAAG